MEVKKTVSPIATIIQQKDSADSEKKSVKSNAASVKDSFEVVKNNNGGLFAENRFTQPTGENSGPKDLTPSEQQQASNMNYKDFMNFKNSSTSSQDNRTKYEDVKNSGMLEGLGHGKQDIDETAKERIKGSTAENIRDLNSPMAPEQTNAAVQQLTGDTSLRDFVKQEVDERHQDYKLGNGTALERFAKSMDPSATPDRATPTGKDQIAYNRESDRKNPDGTTTHIEEQTHTFGNGMTQVFRHESTEKKDGTEFHVVEYTRYNQDNSKVEYKSEENYDKNDKLTNSTSTTTTTKEDGTVTTSTTTTTKNKDGSTTTTTTEKTTPPGGGTKSYDPENYKGNIPEVLQRTMDHFKEQAKKLRPEGGGERVLTDGGASGTPVVGGEVGNVSPRMGGIVGMVGQPSQAGEEIGHHTGGLDGGSNPDLNGGATDVDGNNWTGRTIEDDPTNVHFGPADQPKQQADSKDEESKDSSKSFLNSFRQIRA
jgi:hypothetical protein